MSADTDLTSRLIDIKVLSQLPHPHGTIQFHGIRAGTHVWELKQLIRDAVSSHPPIDTQRLIYRGRLLTRDDVTLTDVFGNDSIQRGDTHTLHLVIRGEIQPSTTTAASATQSQDHPVRRPTPTAPQLTMPAQHQLLHQQHLAAHHHMPFAHNQTAQFQFPHRHHSPVAPATAGQLQPPGTESSSINTNQPTVLPQTPFQPHQPRAIHHHPPFLNQQFQQPAFPTQINQPPAGVQVNGMFFANHPAQAQMPPLLAAHQAMLQNQNPTLRSTPSPTIPNMNNANSNGGQSLSSGATAGQMRDGTVTPESRQYSHASAQIPTNARSEPQPHFQPPHIPFPPLFSFPTQQIVHGPLSGIDLHGQLAPSSRSTAPSRHHPGYPGWLGAQHAIEYLQNLQNRLEMALHLCRWSYPPEGDPTRPIVVAHGLVFLRDLVNLRNIAQMAVNNVLRDGPSGEYPAPSPQQVSVLHSLNNRFREIVQDWSSDFESIRRNRPEANASSNLGPSSNVINVNSPSSNSTVQPTTSGSNQTAAVAYILHSPSGPSAVLYDGQNAYFSSPSSISPGSTLQPNLLLSSRSTSGQNLATTADARSRYATDQPQIQLNNIDAERLRQGLQQAQDQGGNVIAINLTPIFHGLWLFVRVYVFIWVFLGGRGLGNTFLSWRTLAIFVICFGYWTLRAGIGAERLEVIRRYWNDLVGVGAAGDQPQGQGERPNEPARQADQAGTNAENATTPARTSSSSTERLQTQSRQRAQHTEGRPQAANGSLRELTRPIERTLALFVGSLFPGVGERHVAERERMRREAEERDRARAATAASEARDETTNATPSDPSAMASPTDQTSTAGKTSTQNGPQASSSAIEISGEQDGITERRPASSLDS